MGGDGESFHAPRILVSIAVHFCENNGQGNPAVRADVFHSYIQLDDASQRLQTDVSQIHRQRVAAAVHLQVHGNGTGLRGDRRAALHRHGGSREGDRVPLGVGVVDRVVDQLYASGLSRVADEKLQGSAFISGHSQSGDRPAEGSGSGGHGAASGRRGDGHQLKIGI